MTWKAYIEYVSTKLRRVSFLLYKASHSLEDIGPCVFGFRGFSALDAEFTILRHRIYVFATRIFHFCDSNFLFYAENQQLLIFCIAKFFDFVTKILPCPPKIPPLVALNDIVQS